MHRVGVLQGGIPSQVVREPGASAGHHGDAQVRIAKGHGIFGSDGAKLVLRPFGNVNLHGKKRPVYI
jgi:hypothetical protein